PAAPADRLPCAGSAPPAAGEDRKDVLSLTYRPCCHWRAGVYRRWSACEYRLQGLDQRGFLDRLGEVVPGALALAPHPVGFLVLGCHYDHRDTGGFRILGQLTGRLEAVEAGHDDVHQH